MNVHSSGVLMLCKKRSLVLIIINFITALSFAIFMYIVVYKGMLQSAILIFLQKSVFDIVKGNKLCWSRLLFVLQKNDNWDWWSCAPTIKACFTDPGVMEVFWEEPNAVQKKLIKGYQVQY